ncbi:hypothetical protein [Nocardioides sp.]|uniref:hypothetical protein n=1 Tax=Nocardioides sp. TaxID=35761 RepID=UPI00356456AA
MTVRTSVATTTVALLVAGLGALTTSATGSTPRSHPPAPDTIVDVTGDRDNGFGIHHYDGSKLWPPTWSESRAECGEYDTRVARVRCRTGVRVWFRDLEDLQQALAWARHQD